MRLIKHAHACVELGGDDGRLLVDPGALGDAPGLDGIAAVLVTHGHYDHAGKELITDALGRGIPVYAPSDLPAQLGLESVDGLRTLGPGERLTVAGFDVATVGGRHAAVHPDVAGPENLGYLIDDRVLVTGDEHPEVDGPVRLLATPVDAPWLRAVDLISFVRRVRPETVLGVHDGLLNDDGLVVADAVLGSLTREGAGEAVRLRVGAHLDL